MALRVNFYLDGKPDQTKNLLILMFVGFNGYRFKYYTGFRFDVLKILNDKNELVYDKDKSKWDFEKQRAKNNTSNGDGFQASTINAQLNKLESLACEIVERYKALKQPLSKETFKTEIEKLDKDIPEVIVNENLSFYTEQYKKNADISEGRLKQMKVTFTHFETFLKSERKINDISIDTIELFEKDLKEKGNKGRNTVSCNMQRLRAFFNYAESKDWIKDNPFKKFKIEPEKYGRPIALTKAELEILYTKDLSKIPEYEKVRDLFVFQCCIGCRVADLLRLTKDNIIDNCIRYVPAKTKGESPTPVSIPLNDKAKHILSKYENTGHILPVINSVDYNEDLKELFSHCKITRQVVRLNPLTGIEETVSLAKIASSHLARRTFISILHKKVKDSVIASMTGHSKTSKAFARYYDIEETQKEEAINLI